MKGKGVMRPHSTKLIRLSSGSVVILRSFVIVDVLSVFLYYLMILCKTLVTSLVTTAITLLISIFHGWAGPLNTQNRIIISTVMKNHIFGFPAIIIAVFISLNAQAQQLSKEDKEKVAAAELALSQAVNGVPLRIALWWASDPAYFLLPVSNSQSKDSLAVDRLYIVDATHPESFDYNSCIYAIDSLKKYNEEIGCNYAAVVHVLNDKTLKRFEIEIDGFMFHEIYRKINQNLYDFSSRIRVPLKIVDLVARKEGE